MARNFNIEIPWDVTRNGAYVRIKRAHLRDHHEEETYGENRLSSGISEIFFEMIHE